MKMNDKLDQMLKEWDDPCGARTMSEAEDLINELQITLAGKEELIRTLQDDIAYFDALVHIR